MANGQITVSQLLKLCQEQVKKGNGDRMICLSDDNEGNGYHGMFYGFTEVNQDEKEDYPIYDSTEEEDMSKIIILG